MRRIVLFALATLFATSAFAQQQLATLNHNDSITVFYGQSALEQAHAAAVNGDIITLSPGRFQTNSSLTITKAVTIRGAGMMDDTLGNTHTEIDFFVYFDIDTNLNDYLSVEGIRFKRSIDWKKLKSPTFIKCFVSSFSSYYSSSRMIDAKFINCYIRSFNCSHQKNTQFINSIINENISGLSSLDNEGVSFLNCNVKHSTLSEDESSRCYILNSIFVGLASPQGSYNATTSFYSLGVNDAESWYESRYYFDTVYTPNHNLHNISGTENVFMTYSSDSWETMTFELQDSIANTFLGNDGTQVGIYGGPYPFDPNVRNPRIKRCTVAQRATSDNKLAVDIEVVSE